MVDWESETVKKIAFKRTLCTLLNHYTYLSQEEQNPDWQKYYDSLSEGLETISEELERTGWPILSDERFHSLLATFIVEKNYENGDIYSGARPMDRYVWSVLVLSQYEFYEGDN